MEDTSWLEKRVLWYQLWDRKTLPTFWLTASVFIRAKVLKHSVETSARFSNLKVENSLFCLCRSQWAYGKEARNGNGNGMDNWNGNSCMVVSNHWTGLTQTTSFGVGQKLNIFIQPINCSRAWSGIFPRVSGGQRYLISCNEKIRRALILSRNQFPALIEAHRNRIVSSITTLKLIC